MIIFEIIIILVLPFIMVYVGTKHKNFVPPYNSRGFFVYGSRYARKSEEAWKFANYFFGHLLFSCGINVGLVCLAFFLAAVFAAGTDGLITALIILAVQLISLLFPYSVTGTFLRKTYDENGVKRKPKGGYNTDWDDNDIDNDNDKDWENWNNNNDDDWGIPPASYDPDKEG